MSLLRRQRLPDAVTAVRLPPGERRIAWATTDDGGACVATDRGLLLPGVEPLPWDRVERAAWQPPLLTVLEVAEVEGGGSRHELLLPEPRDLPETVRARVTASVAWAAHERLSPTGGVRVVGRRVPGAEVLQWQLVYDAGTDRDDPLVRAQAEALLEAARRSIG